MIKNIYFIAFVFLSLFAEADYKQLNCTIGNDKWVAVFDTEDFSKDEAKYELTWIQWSTDITQEGKTFRLGMAVTPSTISLEYCAMPTELRALYPSCIATESFGSLSMWRTWDINRKDLSFASSQQRGGSCTLEDYASENVL
jgi:hypothetical protein